MESVRGAAVQLISENLDVARAVEEACEPLQSPLSAPLLQADPLSCCSRDVVPLLQTQAASSGLPAALLATQHVCSVLANCWSSSGCHRMLSSEQRARLAGVTALVAHLQDSLMFLPQHFLHFVKERLQSMPLEAVVSLHTAGLLSLEALLQEAPAATDYIVSAVVDVSTALSEEDQQEQERLMQAVAHFIVELTSQHKSSLAAQVVRQLTVASLARPLPATYSLVEALGDCLLVSPSEATDLASLMLTSSLMEPQMSLVDALSQQEQWRFAALPPPVASFYEHIASALDSSLCIQLLQRAITVEKLNWPALLQFVACFLNTNESASRKIKVLIQSLMSSAMLDCDLHQLNCVLLLARQSSLEGSHLFPSYPQWFQATFGDGVDTVVTGKKQLLFLLKCLTKLAPHEPIFTLKAHLAHPPHRIAKCHSQLTDYAALASTRLQDLGEKVPAPGHSEEEKRDSEGDVCSAVEYFKAHRKIPQTVMEASIFRQPYFVGKFLPALLTPAVGQHERQELIEALDREKKIPPRMLRNYEKGCEELRSQGSTHTLNPPLSYASMAGALQELTLAAGHGKSFSAVSRILSRLSSLLQVELGSHGGTNQLGRTVQLVDDLLSAAGEAMALQTSRMDTSCKWISDLLSMLTAHTNLHWPLYLRLKELLTSQLSEMTQPQLVAVAVLLCELYCLSPTLCSVEVEQESLKTGQDYCLSLLAALRHDTGRCMTQALRFGCLFVHLLMSHDNIDSPVPQCLLNKMVYIYRREQFLRLSNPHWRQSSKCDHQMEDVMEAVETLLNSQHFMSQWQTSQMRLQEWLSWELKLDPSSDPMSGHCRRSYQRHEAYGQFFQTYSLQQLFEDTFQCLVQHAASVGYADGFSLLQELCSSLPAQEEGEPSCLLGILQGVLATGSDDDGGCTLAVGEKELECVILASSLPPYLLFTNHLRQPQGLDHVAAFIQNTLVPLVSDGMALPLYLTHYLSQGVLLLGEDSHGLLCTACPAYLCSVVAHWPYLRCLAQHDVLAADLASWIHSGMCSHPTPPSPPSSGPLVPALAVGVFQHLRHGTRDGELPEKLSLLPPEVVVLVAECCVRHLAPLSAFSSSTGSDVQALLQACLLQESSSVEVFHTELDLMDLKHKQLLAGTRTHFPCTPATLLLYPVLLLKLLPGLEPSLLHRLMKQSCFVYLCVTAHRHCLQLNTPLPFHPPSPSLVYQPLSAQFMQDCAAALMKIIHLASTTQLEGILEHCHAHLKPLVHAKLHSAM